MNAVNSVQLFLLAWAFVCRADDVCSISCEDVTGTVGEEVTLTCSVSLKRPECCFIVYKFQYPEKYKDSTICKEDLQGSCEQRNSFTCRYTPTTSVLRQFRFFVQTMSGTERTEFTVNITESRKPENSNSAHRKEDPKKLEDPGPEAGPRSSGTVVPTVMGFFIILILIITMTIIYKTKSNYTKPCGFQKGKVWVHRHDEVNSNCPENVINSPELTV